jgi:hypothetical protein
MVYEETVVGSVGCVFALSVHNAGEFWWMAIDGEPCSVEDVSLEPSRDGSTDDRFLG